MNTVLIAIKTDSAQSSSNKCKTYLLSTHRTVKFLILSIIYHFVPKPFSELLELFEINGFSVSTGF